MPKTKIFSKLNTRFCSKQDSSQNKIFLKRFFSRSYLVIVAQQHETAREGARLVRLKLDLKLHLFAVHQRELRGRDVTRRKQSGVRGLRPRVHIFLENSEKKTSMVWYCTRPEKVVISSENATMI